MAYSTELKRKAKDLYVVQGNSLRKTAKILNFNRWQTIQKWSKEEKWGQKRVSVETETSLKAEKDAFNELVKDKQDYITENLKATDLNKKAGLDFLLTICEELKKGNPGNQKMQELADLYRTVSGTLNKSILIQHKILSGNYDSYNQDQVELEKRNTLNLIINRAKQTI